MFDQQALRFKELLVSDIQWLQMGNDLKSLDSWDKRLFY